MKVTVSEWLLDTCYIYYKNQYSLATDQVTYNLINDECILLLKIQCKNKLFHTHHHFTI